MATARHMNIKLKNDIEINILSFSYVAVWKTLQQTLPGIDNKFAKDLFGNPYNTNTGVGPEGFFITLQGTNPQPSVLLGPQRFAITHVNIDDILKVYEDFLKELKRISPALSVTPISAYGINFEIEISNLGRPTSQLWLGDRFVRNGLNNVETPVICHDIRFQVFNGDKENTLIHLQPRYNNPSNLFIIFNQHFDLTQDTHLHNPHDLRLVFSEAVQKTENQIIEFFLS